MPRAIANMGEALNEPQAVRPRGRFIAITRGLTACGS